MPPTIRDSTKLVIFFENGIEYRFEKHYRQPGCYSPTSKVQVRLNNHYRPVGGSDCSVCAGRTVLFAA